MFGWFAPKCPLNTWEKTWTETRMRWLADRLGIGRLLKAQVVTPTPEFFPDDYRGDPEQVRRIFDRLCFYLGLDPLMLDLEIDADTSLPKPVGHYEAGPRPLIRVAQSQLADPGRLIATLAHELAHHILVGGGHLPADGWEQERITDLLPVYLGLGIFGANATLHERYTFEGGLSWWMIGSQGYLPARIFGYALALFARMRGEDKPDWAEYLRLDALAAMRDGLHYLQHKNDSLFDPESIRQPRLTPRPPELADRLADQSPTVRLATIWEIRERGLADESLAAGLIDRLDDRDPWIPGEAAQALGEMGALALPALPRLLRALHDRREETRHGAALAIGQLPADPADAVPILIELLNDPSLNVVGSAARALARFGPQAESALDDLLSAFRNALVECEEPLLDVLLATLHAIAGDPRQLVRDYLSDDPELCRQAMGSMDTRRNPSEAGSPEPPHDPEAMQEDGTI